MERIAIIGSAGSGKSTFSVRLGNKTNLPVYHLDRYFWNEGWEKTKKEDWKDIQMKLVNRERWIIDGNYGSTLDIRLKRADTIIYFDLPRIVCIWRILKRYFSNIGRNRPDMAEGCEERLNYEFLKWVWDFPEKEKPELEEHLRDFSGTIIKINSNKDMEKFFEKI